MDVMLVFNVVVALFGAYMIWSALQMKKSGRINSMVLAQEELKKVKDTKGFIEFLYWREMLFGALVLIVGVLGVLNETVMPIGKASILEVIIFPCSFHLVSEFIGESERESFYIYNMSYIKNSCHGNRPEPVISGVFPVATVFLILTFLHRNISFSFANILVCRTHDLATVCHFLKTVCTPAGDSCNGKNRCVKFYRES